MKQKGIFRYYRAPDIDPPVLVPQDDRAFTIMDHLAPDRKALITVHAARWPEHHRLMMLAFSKIAEAVPGQTVDTVLMYLKRETGRFEWVELLDGSTVEAYHSIAFESMSQDTYAAFSKQVIAIIEDQLLPKVGQAVLDEVRDLLLGQEPT